MSTKKLNTKEMLSTRLSFFIEVFIVFIVAFLLSLIPYFVIPLFISIDSLYYGISFYLFRAILLIISIPLALFFSQLLVESKKPMEIPPYKKFGELFLISHKNYPQQLYHGILLLFLMFIPLDFFTYLVLPQMTEYVGRVLSSNTTDIYLLSNNYLSFLFSVIIIQISVALYEEAFNRGFITARGADHVKKTSAIMISALSFGFGHFAYYLSPISREFPAWYPIIWFIQATAIGIILSAYICKKGWIFPLIFAHACNNIISAHALWNYFQGNSFEVVALLMYAPLLSVSILLILFQFKKIKSYLQSLYKEFIPYFYVDRTIGATRSNLFIKILLDIILALIIFGLNLIL